MLEKCAHKAETRLTLRSQLAELKLVAPWVDALAAQYAIPGETHFAIDLCLEEALSNIIRHGYGGEPDHAITVELAAIDNHRLTFTVEDSAPHFALSEPTEATDSLPAEMPASIQEFQPWGHGIPLMRRFAGTLTCEQLPGGNRLTLGFPVAPPEQPDTPGI